MKNEACCVSKGLSGSFTAEFRGELSIGFRDDERVS